MNLEIDADVIRLNKVKYQVISELLNIMKDWEKTPDYENEAAFTANLEKRQKLIDKADLINKELATIAHQKDYIKPKHTYEQLELVRKSEEMIRQIQEIHNRDIQRAESYMDQYLGLAKKIRQGKNGLAAYMKNGLPVRSKQFDLRG